ncbi:MAG TPA: hypothetical protein ENI98_10815 [Gammaproteobacteria bacterium]|nr:hypothetical protein [Gammaproteobacteria bacterium]
MQAMMRGSAYADSFFSGFQGEDYSFMHAMTSDAIPSKAEACRLANQYINQNLGYYNDLLSGSMTLNIGGHRGKNLRNTLYNPYFRLGMAMHTVMDNTSPAHTGFQAWDSSQIGRHGDNIPLTPFGSQTEEDLNALLSRPDLIGQIVNNMSNAASNGQGLDCSCYQ